ncbi:hypothetical protein ACFORH_34845 [Amycolatopsis roodepoortensis]|uniref:Uncharacterized protein n=1 Tax=Amycolatopsis roodepoortensis TaxID=700274 RepID=A0ABR9L124_9PSEU|nr:hypothetical protein [Amycolatopsis roodepoortensis]MBE1574306.1 hypothetical protein [Amycolatopsis roodepoortensis]
MTTTSRPPLTVLDPRAQSTRTSKPPGRDLHPQWSVVGTPAQSRRAAPPTSTAIP